MSLDIEQLLTHLSRRLDRRGNVLCAALRDGRPYDEGHLVPRLAV